ncbi:MAG: hypothetical protein O3A01_06850, partial [bacterium]|nr:hypothetical protein [bacterium]
QETRDDVIFLSGLAGFRVGAQGDLDTLYLASPNVYFTVTIGGDSSELNMQSVPFSMFSYATDLADAIVMEDVFVTDLTTDRVGMGVASPSVKLHTDGGMRIGDTTGNILGVLRYHSGSLEGRTAAGWTTIDYAPSADYVSKWGIDATEISTNYRVGIGDETPSVSLSVSGNGRVQGDVSAQDVTLYGGTAITIGGTHEFRLDGRINSDTVILDAGVDQWTGSELRVSTGFFGDGSGLTNIGASAIAAGGVASSDIANFSVSQAKITDNAVDNRVLGEGAVDLTKFVAGILFTETYFADGAITGSKIGFGQVASDDLTVGFTLPVDVFLDDVLTAEKITDTEIIGSKIATAAVTRSKLVLDAVTSAKVTGSGVVSQNIGAGVISSNKIATGAILASDISGLIGVSNGGTGVVGGSLDAIPYYNGTTIAQDGIWKWDAIDRELQFNNSTGAQLSIESDDHALIGMESATNATASIQLQNNTYGSQFAISPSGVLTIGSTVGSGHLKQDAGLIGISGIGTSRLTVNGAMTIGDADQSPVQEGTIRFDGDFQVYAGGDWRILGGASGFEGISQGEDNDANTTFATVLGGFSNTAMADYSTAVGGMLNNIDDGADYAVIGGGFTNLITSGGSATYATLLGGNTNEVVLAVSTLESHQFMGGGADNEVQLRYSFVAGGDTNRVYAQRSGIWGGQDNTISSGGQNNVILGGDTNTIQANADYATIAGGKDVSLVNDYNVKGGSNETFTWVSTLTPHSGVHYAASSGGRGHRLGAAYTSVAGGESHQLNGAQSSVLAGSNHTVFGPQTGVFAGNAHQVHGQSSSVFVGRNGVVSGVASTIVAGDDVIAAGDSATVMGGAQQYAQADGVAMLPGRVQQATGGMSVVGAGRRNTAAGELSVVVADRSSVTGHYGAVMGGSGHTAGDGASVIGGLSHDVDAFGAVALGGHSGTIKADLATIIGGVGHVATGVHSTIVGGFSNQATGLSSTVMGGHKGVAFGADSTVVGGQGNRADTGAVAMGRHAHAAAGSFAFSDGFSNLESQEGEFALAASGGVHFITGEYGIGSSLSAYGGGWSHVSDRATKQDFVPVNYLDVLNSIASFPTATWRYKSESSRHMGPMAQDFYQAFQLGESDTRISAVDADGVALAGLLGALDLLRTQQYAMALSIQRYNLARAGFSLAQDSVAHMPVRMKAAIRSITHSGPSMHQLRSEGQELDKTMSQLRTIITSTNSGGQSHD